MNMTAENVNTRGEYAIHTKALNLWYGTFQALFDINLDIKQGIITSLIGPSGCGKSTFLRSVNRINERLGYVRTEGLIEVMGRNIYDNNVELVQVRKQVGMVFQRPNPLPISIRENIIFGHKLHNEGRKPSDSEQDEIIEAALRKVLLWDQVKDRRNSKATELSLEEQELAACTSYAYWFFQTYYDVNPSEEKTSSELLRIRMAMREARRHLVGASLDEEAALDRLRSCLQHRKVSEKKIHDSVVISIGIS